MHKLRDILLLLLRLLAIACLVLGFSMPFIKKEGLASVENEDESEIYLFVDASLSMTPRKKRAILERDVPFPQCLAFFSHSGQEPIHFRCLRILFSSAFSFRGMEDAEWNGAAHRRCLSLTVYQKWKRRIQRAADHYLGPAEESMGGAVSGFCTQQGHDPACRTFFRSAQLIDRQRLGRSPFTHPGLEQRLQVQVRNHSSKSVSSTLELLQDRRVENFESIELDAGAVEIISLNFIPGGSGHAQLQLTDRSWSFDNIFHIAWNQAKYRMSSFTTTDKQRRIGPGSFRKQNWCVLWKDETEDAAGTTADLIVLADRHPGSGLMERGQLAQSGAIW